MTKKLQRVEAAKVKPFKLSCSNHNLTHISFLPKTSKSAEMTKLKTQLQDIGKDEGALKKARDEATNFRKELWREEAQLENARKEYQHRLEKGERKFQYTMDKVARQISRCCYKTHALAFFSGYIQGLASC